jgi:preprotein translocase subunit SecA
VKSCFVLTENNKSAKLGNTMSHFLDRFLGDPNKKVISGYAKRVDSINALIDEYKALNDDELSAKTTVFKKRVEDGESLDDILIEAFATAREMAKRTLGQFHYDVQLMGGIALHEQNIAEMRTGEGKTLTATLAVYLNALSGKGVHVVTVNDYLAKRDAVWMGQVYHALGLSVGIVQHEGGYIYDPTIVPDEDVVDEERDETGAFKVEHAYLRPVTRGEAYKADITYGTNNEFGFDYLRDNMVAKPEQRVQRELNFCVVDEIDSILIDEARTPLIISAPSETPSEMYKRFAQLVRGLKADEDYNIDEKMKAATLTDEGIEKLETALGIDNLYATGGIQMVHHIEQALRAEVLYKDDREYVVREGEIVIVDEFTGRMMEGRRFSEGLHQAIEAKEGVEIKQESQTLGTITFQNYFRMYEKLSGMTGTAKTEEEEFQKIYDMSVVVVPTNREIMRADGEDRIFKDHKAKLNAIVKEVQESQSRGQPVLLGTVSIDKNEELAAALKKAGVSFEMLNAKNHESEGEIVAQAGRKGAVTVATNMAGRGVDIVLGGNPSSEEEQKEIKELGGLYVIGTERHESRRIDNQLRGRAGRQGDPGRTQFFVCLDDDLMRIFGSDRMKKAMETLRVPDDMPIENKMISKSIESAQKKVEGHNFDIRKRLLDYDDVLNKQRESVYGMRREVVDADTEKDPIAMRKLVLEHVTGEIENVVAFHTVDGTDWNLREVFETMKTIVDVDQKTKDRFMEYDGVKAPKAEDAAKLRNELVETLEDRVEKKYVDLENVFENRSEFVEIEKQLLIRSTDTLWIEHLSAMRKLRSAVGLQGYGQRDPLVEYKRESFNMFQMMMAEVQKQVAYTIFKIGDAVKMAKLPGLADRIGMGKFRVKAPNIDGSKIGRNDPCHCGATKADGKPVKYKHCHGKN